MCGASVAPPLRQAEKSVPADDEAVEKAAPLADIGDVDPCLDPVGYPITKGKGKAIVLSVQQDVFA